ncbi:hypothetical protein F5X99DRAFT_384388 [Biscogniauxia marginata]|nr:hypothetical protein F5X99DRAFT_384388 [Biscogniauxia marginata]
MRLACICDNGEVLDIGTALQQQPYVARGLLADAIFQCQQSIPDTLDFLHTERVVRDSLLAFQGIDEKYARAYVLTRTLDPRTQKTPRANLLYSSFNYGGPVAVAGVFYATFDAHRNLRSREVLDFLLNRASNESQLQVITRASTFPCNPSMAGWLLHILERLEPRCGDLASIIWRLGPVISKSLFHRARKPSLTWAPNGEPAAVDLGTDSVVTDEEEFNKALVRLEYIGFVRVSETTINMERCIAYLLREWFEQHTRVAEAIQTIAHAFPKYYHLEPTSYAEQCQLLLPQLENVFTYLGDLQIDTLVSQECLVQLTESCLSASYFRDKPWKLQATSMATEAARAVKHLPEQTFLMAMIDVRKSFLAHLYQEIKQGYNTFPTIDHRSKVLSADLAILKAKECVRLNTLASASEKLANFDSPWPGRISRLGTIQARRVAVMRAKVLRYEGRFQESYNILHALPQESSKILALLGSVLCELGKCDEAIQRLHMYIAAKSHLHGTELVKLALANAYLLSYMHQIVEKRSQDWHSLQVSRDILQELAAIPFPVTYYGRMNQLSVLIGLAIIDHLNGRVESALGAWNAALAASKQCLPTGYTDVIISYSTSELEARRGATAQSDILRSYTGTLFARTGRQYHFLGLGSLWPDIIGGWLTALGKEPAIPIRIFRSPVGPKSPSYSSASGTRNNGR